MTLALKDAENCLTISQIPNIAASNGPNAERTRLEVKTAKCSEIQSTICMHQKNDEVVLNTAPSLPRFPCQPKVNEETTTMQSRKKRNIDGN